MNDIPSFRDPYRNTLRTPTTHPPTLLELISFDPHKVTLPVNPDDMVPDALSSACKALLEYVGWRGDPVRTASHACEMDSLAAFPRILRTGIQLLSMDTCSHDADVMQELDTIEDISESDHDMLHVSALRYLAAGDMSNAAFTYRDILRKWPRDLLAIKFIHDVLLILGDAEGLRDALGSVLPEWEPYENELKVQGEFQQNKEDYIAQWKYVDLYGILLGMHAFGLEETRLYDMAEEQARSAIRRNRNDGWAHHALAHVKEMQGKAQEGIEALKSYERCWKDSNLLACHIYWHIALFYIEKGQHNKAMEIYYQHILDFVDPERHYLNKNQRQKSKKKEEEEEGFGLEEEVKLKREKDLYEEEEEEEKEEEEQQQHSSSTTPSVMDLVDASSLLVRLELQRYPVEEATWDALADVMMYRSSLIHRRVTVFGDAHLIMTISRSHKHQKVTRHILMSIDRFAKNKKKHPPQSQQHFRTNNTGIIIPEGPFGDKIEVDEQALHLQNHHHRHDPTEVDDEYYYMEEDVFEDQKELAAEFGLRLCRAVALHQMDDDQHITAELLLSLRRRLPRIGGSYAQRDVFHQMLINAAVRCAEEHHDHEMRDIAQWVINERRMMLPEGKIRDIDQQWAKRLNALREK